MTNTPEEQAGIDRVQARWDALRARERPLRGWWSDRKEKGVLSLEEFCVDVLGKGYPMPWEAVISDTLEQAVQSWAHDLDFAESAVGRYAEYLWGLRDAEEAVTTSSGG